MLGVHCAYPQQPSSTNRDSKYVLSAYSISDSFLSTPSCGCKHHGLAKQIPLTVALDIDPQMQSLGHRKATPSEEQSNGGLDPQRTTFESAAVSTMSTAPSNG